MALMEALERLDAVLDRTLELTGHAPASMGPFTAAFHTPAGMLLRDAEPGEREMFAYVGPKATATSTHAAPSVPDQPFFEFTPLQPATPLRPRPAKAPPIEPEVLLEAALKLMDGFRPMPRKRKLAVAQLAKVEALRESIARLEQDLVSGSTFESDAGKKPVEEAQDDESFFENLLAKEEAEVKALERKIMLARKMRATPAPSLMSPMRVQMAAPPTPKSARRPVVPPSPRSFSTASQLFKLPPPSAAQTSVWQTPTITRFLSNSQKSRTPGSLVRPTPLSFGAPAAARSSTAFADTSIILEGSQADHESLLDEIILDDGDSSFLGAGNDDGDDTVVLSLPTPAASVVAAPVSPPPPTTASVVPEQTISRPALVDPPLQIIPDVAEAAEPEPEAATQATAASSLTDTQVAILTKLWTPFGDILRQSPLAPSSSDETLPARETFDAIKALSELPPPAAPTSITSTTSSSTPAFPVTAQGILLAHVFLCLLEAEAHSLTMSAIKAKLAEVPGGQEAGVKVIYYAVGKRGLAIKRAGGEARVEFA